MKNLIFYSLIFLLMFSCKNDEVPISPLEELSIMEQSELIKLFEFDDYRGDNLNTTLRSHTCNWSDGGGGSMSCSGGTCSAGRLTFRGKTYSAIACVTNGLPTKICCIRPRSDVK